MSSDPIPPSFHNTDLDYLEEFVGHLSTSLRRRLERRYGYPPRFTAQVLLNTLVRFVLSARNPDSSDRFSLVRRPIDSTPYSLSIVLLFITTLSRFYPPIWQKNPA